MPKTIINAVKKTARQDSTVVLNSLLHTRASSTKMTDEEKMVAGYLALIDGPAKISYGLLMMAGGMILAPIPFVVANVSTLEVVDANGARIEATGVGLNLRTPKSPLHFKREASAGGRTIIQKGWHLGANINIGDPTGVLPDHVAASHNTVHANTTVTGYGLATTGLGRVITGAFDPIVGPIKGTFFAVKVLTRSHKENTELEARPAPSATR